MGLINETLRAAGSKKNISPVGSVLIPNLILKLEKSKNMTHQEKNESFP